MKARTLFTDRFGGVSSHPYESFNFALHVGDDPLIVAKNRAILASQIGVEISKVHYMNQVHGKEVALIDTSTAHSPSPTADALFTTEPGIALVVLTADCIPLLLLSDRAIAAVHVGRKGLVERIAPETIRAFREHGIEPDEITAVMGASICGRCYEVDIQMYDVVVARIPECATSREKHTLDLIAGLQAQLGEYGITPTIDRRCTAEDSSLFSYRRDDVTGRQASVVILQ